MDLDKRFLLFWSTSVKGVVRGARGTCEPLLAVPAISFKNIIIKIASEGAGEEIEIDPPAPRR